MAAAVDRLVLGRTDNGATAVGLGGGYLAKRGIDTGIAVVRAALDAGLTYFDTSPGYGRSQEILGWALEGVEDAFLATKIGHLPNDNDYRFPQALWGQLYHSLSLLKREHVDLLQIHEADRTYWWGDCVREERVFVEPGGRHDFADAPIMRVLKEARQQGLCRYIGITGNNPRALSRVLRAVDVDTCLLAYNYDLVWRTACTEVMPLAGQKGVALLLASINHLGRFVEVCREWLEEPPDWMTPELGERFASLYDIQRRSGLSLIELGVRFVLGEERAALLLAGASKPQQIEESVAAARRGPLPQDLYAEIAALGIEGLNWR